MEAPLLEFIFWRDAGADRVCGRTNGSVLYDTPNGSEDLDGDVPHDEQQFLGARLQHLCANGD